ncbi:MAG: CPBP family intramembrane glutamic endopeptidase, partial [Planctomycetaceae bacterium]
MDVVGIAILGIMLVGSVAVWACWIRSCRGRSVALVMADCRRPPRTTARIPLSATAAICLLWMLIPAVTVTVLNVSQTPSIRTVQAGCVAHLLLLLCALCILSACGVRLVPRQQSLGDWCREIRHGLIGFLASCLPVFLTLWGTNRLRSEDTQHSYLKLITDAPDASVMVWIVLAAVVMAPLVEELIFRVVLQTALSEWIGTGQAICGVALLFAAIHGWPDVLPLIPLALILG